MNQYHLLFVAHVTILLAATGVTAQRLYLGTLTRICAGFILLWSNLVYTALVLSAFSQLGRPWPYFAVSVVLALVLWRVTVRLCTKPVRLFEQKPRFAENRLQRAFTWFLMGTLAAAG